MLKKVVKEKIKAFIKTAEDNQRETKTIDILNPLIPKRSSSICMPQAEIKRNVNLYTAEKSFNLFLDNGPYKADYTRDGTNLLLHSNTGYISSFNTQHLSPGFEISLDSKVHDAKWLHNEQFFAAAQESSLYIYDNSGAEVHAVRQVASPRLLEFLPYHFLLAIMCKNGNLAYLDTSTGSLVAEIGTRESIPICMSQNPSNAVVHVGCRDGNMTLWSPAQKEYLMKINCHDTPVTGIEIDMAGTKMVTTGLDNRLKVFDIRNTFQPLKNLRLKSPAAVMSQSQRGLLALANNRSLIILKNYEDIYMKEIAGGEISSLEFCPFEDILTIGHSNGISNVIIPGSGDPIYDSLECSPFLTKRQKKEIEIKRLLEKIPFDLIAQKTVLGAVNEEAKKSRADENGERYFDKEKQERTALCRFSRKV